MNSLHTLSLRTGLDRFLVLENYGNKWRLFRRLFHQSFHVDTVERYRPIQRAAARKLVHLILQSPKDVLMYTKLYVFAPALYSGVVLLIDSSLCHVAHSLLY